MQHTLEVVTNTTCNLGCYFCFAKDNTTMTSHMLSFDNFKKSVDFMLEKRIGKDDSLLVKIYGGEATFNKNLFKMIDYVCGLNNEKITVALITNLTNEIDKIITYLNKFNSFHISVSMEGSKGIHDKIRFFKSNKNGSYDLIIHNLTRIISETNRKRITIQTVLSPELIENIDDYINFIDENKKIGKFEIMPMNDSTFQHFDFNKMEIALKKFVEYIKESYIKNDYQHIGLFQFSRIFLSKYLDKKYKAFCHMGVYQLTIMPNGDLYPCSKAYYSNKTHLSYGNISVLDFELLNNTYENFKNYYKDLISLKSSCSKCLSNNVGCLGLCIMEPNESNYHVCLYNIILDKYTNILIEFMKKELETYIRR